MEEEEEEKTWGFGFQIKPDSDSGATPQHSYTLVNLWRGNSSGTMHLWEHDMMTSWWCQSEALLDFCQLTIFGTSHWDGLGLSASQNKDYTSRSRRCTAVLATFTLKNSKNKELNSWGSTTTKVPLVLVHIYTWCQKFQKLPVVIVPFKHLRLPSPKYLDWITVWRLQSFINTKSGTMFYKDGSWYKVPLGLSW